jgi:hypothetical protein
MQARERTEAMLANHTLQAAAQMPFYDAKDKWYAALSPSERGAWVNTLDEKP